MVVDRPCPSEHAPQYLCLDKGYDNPTWIFRRERDSQTLADVGRRPSGERARCLHKRLLWKTYVE